ANQRNDSVGGRYRRGRKLPPKDLGMEVERRARLIPFFCFKIEPFSGLHCRLFTRSSVKKGDRVTMLSVDEITGLGCDVFLYHFLKATPAHRNAIHFGHRLFVWTVV